MIKILALDLGKFKSVACEFDTEAGEQTFSSNLHNFTGSVIVFAGGNGFGQA